MYITEPALPGQEPNKGKEKRTVEGGAWNATHIRQTGATNKKVNQQRNEASVADQSRKTDKTIELAKQPNRVRVTRRASSLEVLVFFLPHRGKIPPRQTNYSQNRVEKDGNHLSG